MGRFSWGVNWLASRARVALGIPVVPALLAHPEEEARTEDPLWGWNKDRILSAAQDLDDGFFKDAEQLYLAMTRVHRIGAALERRGEGVRRFEFDLEEKEGTPEAIEAQIEHLEELWDQHVITLVDRTEVVKRVVWFGFCVARVSLPLVNGMRVPKLTPWTHGTLDWDKEQVGWTGEDNKGTQVFIPREGNAEWVVFSRGGTKPWLNGDGRKLCRLFAQYLQTDDLWDSSLKELGYAIKVLTTPSILREQKEVDEAWAVVRKLRSGDTYLTPEGYGLSLLESSSGGNYAAFNSRLTDIYASIAIVLLGHNLTQETRAGSLAATEAAMDIPRDASVADAKILTNTYRSVCDLWLMLNFAPEHHPTEEPFALYAPCPHFDTDEPVDEAREAATASANATAFGTFVETALKSDVEVESLNIDWRKQGEKCGVCFVSVPDGQDPPPVKYRKPEPEPAKAKGEVSDRTRRQLGASREPESEGERLGAVYLPDSDLWTVS